MSFGLNHLIPSVEAISFQGASKFALELTELFQSVLDYRDSRRGKSTNIKSDVYKYHMDNVPKAFSNIVFKHTGLIVESFKTSTELDFGYACLMSFGSDVEKGSPLAHNAIAKYSGKKVDYYGHVPESEEEIEKTLENISSKIDTVKGMLNDTKFAGIEKVDHMYCDIYFCYISAYLMNDSVHIEAPEFEAQEITAIMLHEIGHMLSAVEHAGDLVRTHQAMTEETKIYAVNDVNASNIAKATNKGLSKIKLDKGTAKQLELLSTASDTVSGVKEKSGIFGKSIAIIVELIQTVLVLLTSLVGMVILRPLMLVFGNNTELGDILSMYKSKRSDFMTNFGDNCICERYADEYTARHGFGMYQISALGKLHKMVSSAYITDINQGSRESTVVYRIAQFKIYVLMHMFGLGDDTDGEYENEAKRAESLVRDTLKVFKETNMSPELLDFYIKNYEDTVKALDKYKPKGLANKLLSVNVFLTKVVSVPSLIKLLVAGRADSNYQKLMDAARNINANKFHYLRAKLDQLYRQAK